MTLAEVLELGVRAVAAIMASVAAAHEGKVTPDQAAAFIRSTLAELAQHDAAADAALEDKFPAGGGETGE